MALRRICVDTERYGAWTNRTRPNRATCRPADRTHRPVVTAPLRSQRRRHRPSLARPHLWPDPLVRPYLWPRRRSPHSLGRRLCRVPTHLTTCCPRSSWRPGGGLRHLPSMGPTGPLVRLRRRLRSSSRPLARCALSRRRQPRRSSFPLRGLRLRQPGLSRPCVPVRRRPLLRRLPRLLLLPGLSRLCGWDRRCLCRLRLLCLLLLPGLSRLCGWDRRRLRLLRLPALSRPCGRGCRRLRQFLRRGPLRCLNRRCVWGQLPRPRWHLLPGPSRRRRLLCLLRALWCIPSLSRRHRHLPSHQHQHLNLNLNRRSKPRPSHGGAPCPQASHSHAGPTRPGRRHALGRTARRRRGLTRRRRLVPTGSRARSLVGR